MVSALACVASACFTKEMRAPNCCCKISSTYMPVHLPSWSCREVGISRGFDHGHGPACGGHLDMPACDESAGFLPKIWRTPPPPVFFFHGLVPQSSCERNESDRKYSAHQARICSLKRCAWPTQQPSVRSGRWVTSKDLRVSAPHMPSGVVGGCRMAPGAGVI